MQAATDLLHVRETAQTLLQDAGVIEPSWRVQHVRRVDGRTVVLELGPDDGKGIALEWTEHQDQAVPAFVRGEVYSVGYRNAPSAWDVDDVDTPEAVKRAAARACQTLSEAPALVRLCEPEVTAEHQRHVRFDAEAVGAWLFERMTLGHELKDGWKLTEVYPHGRHEVAVAFAKEGARFQPRLKLRIRDDAEPAAFRSRGLDVTYTMAYGSSSDAGRAALYADLARELGLVLESHDRGVNFIAIESDPTAPATPVAEGAPQALNLAIPAPCGQTCNFCSIREEIFPVLDADSPLVTALKEDIKRSAARGAKTLRINGIEPLNAPYLFELLDLAREEGFEEFHLLSTCRPLADREFAERYIAAQPERYVIYVPIYGSSPEIHDGATGTKGAFDEVMRAVTNLKELMDDRGTLIINTVLTSFNIHDRGLRDLIKPLGRWWEVHLPFPNTSSKTDRYRDISVRFSDALEAIYPEGWWPLADLPLGEILPCVAVQHQERTGHALLTPKRLAQRATDPAGTYYRSAGFEQSGGDRSVAFTAVTTPCPHRDTCALSAMCPGKVYALYADLHGLDELVPIDRERIAALDEGEGVLAFMDNQS
jgi:hypothetical protein